MITLAARSVPAHVPPSLVREWPLTRQAPTGEDPFDDIIPRIHDWPEVVFALDGFAPGLHSWVFRRAEDIRAIYLDTEHFSSHGRPALAAIIGDDWNIIPVDADAPDHARYRALLNPLFSPKRVNGIEDRARALARELIGRFAGAGQCEFIHDFARPLPVTIFLTLMGFPLDRMDEFLEWEAAIIAAPDLAPRQWALRNIKAFLLGEIARRRANPGDDLLSEMMRGAASAPPPSDDELLGMATNLFLGGLDTITSTAAWHFKHLATHPDLQAQLRSDPALIPQALEELLRAYAVVSMQRRCVKAIEIRGVTVLPGDLVTVSTPLAARDPQEYDQPNSVVCQRDATHITFGYGPHRCLGSHLARRELLIILQEFLSQIGPFRVAPGARLPMHFGGQMGLDALPLVWDVP